MTSWIKRFALLAVLAGIMSSTLVMGCGGGDEDEAPANNATNKAAKDDADAP